jgi:hypothetical protein
MAGLSDYAENKLLDHVLGTTTYTKPAAVYIQLHTADPGEAGTTAVFADNRRVVAAFAAASGGSASGSGSPVALWSSVTAAGTITHISIWDASTAGNCLWTGALSASKTVAIGNNFSLTSVVASLD